MVMYKNVLPSLGDYLTKNGVVNFEKVDVLLHDIAKIEEESFIQQKSYQDRFEQRKRMMDQQNARNYSY